MATLRMTQTAAGPDGPYQAGREYTAPGQMTHEQATGFVSAGAAEWVTPPVERAVSAPPETRADTTPSVDLSEKTRGELADLAAERGIEVTRADGKDTAPLKSDYVRALGG